MAGAVKGELSAGHIQGASERLADAAQDLELETMHRRVKLELQPHDRERLYAQLLEIREAGLVEAAARGLNGKQASRLMKGAAIQTMHAFIEIDQMSLGQSTQS